MNNYQYYLFDYDGTMCHTQATITNAMQATLRKYQLEVPEDKIQSAIGSGITIREALNTIHPFGNVLTPESLDEMVVSYRSIYHAIDAEHTTLFAGTRELLQNLKEQGKTIVVLSNKGFTTVERSLKYFDLEKYIDLTIADGSLPGLQLKPDPSSYLTVIKKQFRIENDATVLMTGDTASDLRFAKNAGIKSCWASYGYGDQQTCTELQPDYTITALTELFMI
jgi:phosphoglycolate phosphatase